VYSGQNI